MTFRPEEVGESPTYGVYVDSLLRVRDKTRIMLDLILTLSQVSRVQKSATRPRHLRDTCAVGLG